MKTRLILVLAFAALTLGACSASDPAETSENQTIAAQGIQGPQSVCQTDPDSECLQDPEKTSLHSKPASDPVETEVPSSAPPEQAGEPDTSQEPPKPPSQQSTENLTVPTEPTQPSDTSVPEDDLPESPDNSETRPRPEPETPPESEPEPEVSPDPKPTEPESSAFDVQVWVDFAMTYGQQIGLEYDASATDCWDAPITASSQSQYLERDITSRLNRYLERGMSGFSVWAESRSDGKYNLYIGYR